MGESAATLADDLVWGLLPKGKTTLCYDGQNFFDSDHPVFANNDGTVEFAAENGIYGRNVLINHGFGLFSLYGHCSSLNVKAGDSVKAGDVIANTGVTGLAMGDHLHFGMLVQGIEVRPEEWMDNGWMKDNVTGVLNAAKKMVE